MKKITDKTIKQIEELTCRGLNVSEICRFVGISRTAYYKLINSDDKLKNHLELCKNDLGIQAKNIVADRIANGDKDIAKWYLEKRCDDYKKQTRTARLTIST